MGKKNYAYVNKEMLVWARSITPFSSVIDVEIQKKSIKADKLASWESGEDYPSINEAKELAKLYRVPLACFYLQKPPTKTPKKYVDRRTYGGTVYKETSYALWAEIERVISNRDIIVDYSDTFSEEVYSLLPELTSDTSVSEIAAAARKYIGINPPYKNKSSYRDQAFNYFRTLFENKGIMVAQIAGVDLCEMRGLSIYYDSVPIVAINNKDYDRAKTFSLFHELAHLIRRSSSLCLIDFDDRNDGEEKVCDRIAAEILMPSDTFREIADSVYERYLSWNTPCLIEISNCFAVSTASIVRRLYELKMISTVDYHELYDRIVEAFEEAERKKQTKSDEGKPIPYYIRYLNREGYLFPRIITSAYYNNVISYGEMCQALHTNSKHINRIERAVM